MLFAGHVQRAGHAREARLDYHVDLGARAQLGQHRVHGQATGGEVGVCLGMLVTLLAQQGVPAGGGKCGGGGVGVGGGAGQE